MGDQLDEDLAAKLDLSASRSASPALHALPPTSMREEVFVVVTVNRLL
jgi:hypothetical protein